MVCVDKLDAERLGTVVSEICVVRDQCKSSLTSGWIHRERSASNGVLREGESVAVVEVLFSAHNVAVRIDRDRADETIIVVELRLLSTEDERVLRSRRSRIVG